MEDLRNISFCFLLTIYVLIIATGANEDKLDCKPIHLNDSSVVSLDQSETSIYCLRILAHNGSGIRMNFLQVNSTLSVENEFLYIQIYTNSPDQRVFTLTSTPRPCSASFKTPSLDIHFKGSVNMTLSTFPIENTYMTHPILDTAEFLVQDHSEHCFDLTEVYSCSQKMMTIDELLSETTTWTMLNYAFSPELNLDKPGEVCVKQFPECPRRCYCALSSKYFTIDCKRSPMRKLLLIYKPCANLALIIPESSLKRISNFSFKGALYLLASFNSIEVLETGTFNGLTQLQSLEFSFNTLTSLSSDIFANLTNLRLVDLSYNFISELDAKLFQGLHKLAHLRLGSNEITSLPPGIFANLTNMSMVDLSFNLISELDAKLFQGLHKLIDLDLYYNKLASLPLGIFANLTNLSNIYLFSNRLTTLPSGLFANLTNLSSVSLSYNLISELDVLIFQDLHKLSYLDLAYNNLSSLPSGIFANLPWLSKVMVTNNLISKLDAQLFLGLNELKQVRLDSNYLLTLPTSTFANLTNLSLVSLSNNLFSELDAKLFQGIHKLTNLYLSSNKLSSLPSGLFANLTRLSKIRLENNSISELDVNIFQGLHKITDIGLHSNKITSLPSGIFANLTNLKHLRLDDNLISELDINIFQGLHNLTDLSLESNELEFLPSGVFSNLTSLTLVDLSLNWISDIDSKLFQGLHKLTDLNLSSNKLSSLPSGLFANLTRLSKIRLDNNSISELDVNIFQGLHALAHLELHSNKLTSLPFGMFANLTNLNKILLNNNLISKLDANIFQGLHKLLVLQLDYNKLTEIQPLPTDLENLQVLDLTSNNIQKLQKLDFYSMQTLRQLRLRLNNISYIPVDFFEGLSNDTIITVDENEICCFMPDYQQDQCKPLNVVSKSQYLTCKQLLGNNWIRSSMWILGICILLSNVFVIVYGCIVMRGQLKYPDKLPQILLITNLALADFIMGIYMLIVAFADLSFGHNFPLIAEQWRTSLTCKVAGFIAILSSEASLFFLTLISIERLSAFIWLRPRVFPRHRWRVIVTIAVWIVAIISSSIPSVTNNENNYFYDVSEVCIGLPLARKVIYTTETQYVPLYHGPKYINDDDHDDYGSIYHSEYSQNYYSTNAFSVLKIISYSSVQPSDDDYDDYGSIYRSEYSQNYYRTNTSSGFKTISNSSAQTTDDDYDDYGLIYPSEYSQKTNTYTGFEIISDTSTTNGPLYSSILFLGLNLLSCSVVVFCYIAIFLIVVYYGHRYKLRMNTNYLANFKIKHRLFMEVRMTLKIGLVVFTDLACWLPIIFLGILVQMKKKTISPDIFAWFVAFILPINSIINPLIYGVWHILSRCREHNILTKRKENTYKDDRKRRGVRPYHRLAETQL